MNYKYPVEQCDVVDQSALMQFREKRAGWLSWMTLDERHAICGAISSMIWNDIVFRMLSHIGATENQSALNNQLLTEAIVDGHFAVQILGIRRLGSVEIQDSHLSLIVIQAVDGTICFDGRPMGEDAAALLGQADGPWAERQG